MSSEPTVWLVSQYEPAPGEPHRPLRMQCLARELVKRGYSVVQWSACYSHRARKVVAPAWSERQVEPGWIVRFVPNMPYASNVSLKRLASENQFAQNFQRRAVKEPRPVCIVTASNPIVVGEVSVKLGHRFNAPVVNDVLDLWPEFFHRVLPEGIRGAGKAIFAVQYANRRRMWSRLDGLTAVSQTYLRHAIEVAPALKNVPTACAYSSMELDSVQRMLHLPSPVVEKALDPKPEAEVWVGYAGALGLHYEIPVLLRVAEILKAKGAPIRFVVAGFGPFTETIQRFAEQPGSNMTFLGALPPQDLYPMLRRCDLGLLSYSADTTVAIPDKFYDYAAVGLPMVNSLQGEVKTLIDRHDLGVSYVPGDAESMVERIMELVNDPARRAAMRERCVAAARLWDAPGQFEIFADLIETTIRRRNEASRAPRAGVTTTESP